MRNSKRTGNSAASLLASNLGTVAQSVLVHYGIGGTVGRVTPGPRDYQWHIEVVGVHGGPMVLQLQCTEATPIHQIRSALEGQLEE